VSALDEKLSNERKLTAEREDLTRDEIRKLKEDIKDKVMQIRGGADVSHDSCCRKESWNTTIVYRFH